MKKIMMTLVAVAMATTMNAQVYVGGGVGLSVESYDGESNTVWSILPEIGYNINEKWAVGTVIGYGESGKGDHKTKRFEVSPYARYTAVKLNMVNIFFDGGVSYIHKDYEGSKSNTFGFGIKPGVAINLNDKLSFVTHFGFLGYEYEKYKDADKGVNTFGFNLDGSSLTFGLYYNF